MNFKQYFTPQECKEIYEKRDDFNDHDWYWAVATPQTKLYGQEVVAILTTKEQLDKHPEQFDDMELVPAYIRDPHEPTKLHSIYQRR